MYKRQVIDRALQMTLRSYFGDRFPELVECIRKEEDVSALTLSAEDATSIDRLRANLRGGKDPMPEASRQHLRQLLSDEIARMRNLVDFPVEDWV